MPSRLRRFSDRRGWLGRLTRKIAERAFNTLGVTSLPPLSSMRPPWRSSSVSFSTLKSCWARRVSAPGSMPATRASSSITGGLKRIFSRRDGMVTNVPPNWVTAGAAGQCAGWACGASRRRAPASARRDPNAPRKLCRTMPAYSVPAFFWGNCVCMRMLPRCEIKGADSLNIAVDSLLFFV